MDEQNIWEFSAPGWYDFLGPNWVPPDDGYFDPDLIENPDGFDYLPEDIINEENNDTNDNTSDQQQTDFDVNGSVRSSNENTPVHIVPSLTPKGSARRIRPDGSEGPVFTSPVIYSFPTNTKNTTVVGTLEEPTVPSGPTDFSAVSSSVPFDTNSNFDGSYHADDINMTDDIDEPAPSTTVPIPAEMDTSCASLAMLPGAIQPMDGPEDTYGTNNGSTNEYIDRIHSSSPVHQPIILVSPRAMNTNVLTATASSVPVTTDSKVSSILSSPSPAAIPSSTNVDDTMVPIPGTGLVRSPRIELVATLSPAKHAPLPTSPARSTQKIVPSSRKKSTLHGNTTSTSTTKKSAVSTGTFVRRSTRLANITSPIPSFTNTNNNSMEGSSSTTTNSITNPVTPVVTKEISSNLPTVNEEIVPTNETTVSSTNATAVSETVGEITKNNTIDPTFYSDLPQTPAALSLRALLFSSYKNQSTTTDNGNNNTTTKDENEEPIEDTTTVMNTLLNTFTSLRLSLNGNSTGTGTVSSSSPSVSTTPKATAYALSPRPGSAFQATSIIHTGSITPRLSLSHNSTNNTTSTDNFEDKMDSVAATVPTVASVPVPVMNTEHVPEPKNSTTLTESIVTKDTASVMQPTATAAVPKPVTKVNDTPVFVPSSKAPSSTTTSTTMTKSKTASTASSTFSTTARRVSSTMGTALETIVNTVATTTSTTARTKPTTLTTTATKPIILAKPTAAPVLTAPPLLPATSTTTTSSSTVSKPTPSTSAPTATVPTTESTTTHPKSALEKLKQRAAALANKMSTTTVPTTNSASTSSKAIVPVPSSTTTSTTKETTAISTTAAKDTTNTAAVSSARRVVLAETKPVSVSAPTVAVPASTIAVSVPHPTATASTVPPPPTAAPFIPTAILLAKFENGVRDLPIPTTVVSSNGAKDSTTVAQPFQFATDLRAAEKKARRQSGLTVAINGVTELTANTIAAVKQAISVVPPTVPVKETTTMATQETLPTKSVETTKVTNPIPVPKSTEVSTTNVTKSLPSLPAPVMAPVSKTVEHVPHLSAAATTTTSAAVPILPPGHVLGEIPEAVRKAAKLATEGKEGTVHPATTTTVHSTSSTASTTTTAATTTTATTGSKLDKFRDALHRFKSSSGTTTNSATNVPTTAGTTATKGQENTSSSTAATAKPTVTGTTRVPTKAVSPALHTRRRSLERAQFQAALQNNGLQNGTNTNVPSTTTAINHGATKTVALATTSNPSKPTTTSVL